MNSGIYAQLSVSDVEGCPAAAISEEFEVESVVAERRTASAGGGVVGEVTLEHASDAAPDPEAAERVFTDDAQSVYRFANEGEDCPCRRVPDHGCPVREIRATGGSLVLSFVAPDVETLRSIVADLQSCCAAVSVRRLTRSTPDEGRTLLFVNRSAFTDRQYEVLRTAHEMGYFAHPKRADSADVAAALDISVATFSEHLSVAQRKLLDQLFAVA
ncbi:helix-turn-helix domain-containing protein [Haloprofundus salilacus]|uniref:helix-turn-helix domain-containing protein n=1 Tax=Haloprofundus salilacus TaxID=2876190 RepID=UPI001CCB6DA7|nr:helix-turn-helix domain-containing protein [Haloprofundus salilacus]